MSTVVEQPPAQETANEREGSRPDAVNLIQLRPEELTVGHELQYPVYDMGNCLLLAEGNVVTDHFKEILRERHVKEVLIHKADVANATAEPANDDAPRKQDDDTQEGDFSRQLAGRLDSMIDNGSLFVANTGPSFKRRVTFHGIKPYGKYNRKTLLKLNDSMGKSIDNMLYTVLHGGSVKGADIVEMTASYLALITDDMDSVMSLAAEAGQEDSLARHALNMSLLGMAIGVEMGLDEKNIRIIGLCGLVNDWGMVKIPEALRQAERRLNSTEMVQIKKHPIIVLQLLQQVSGIPSMIPTICYQVHERPDGSGYPRGRTHNSIHPFARILNVADAYIAMTSTRPYRPPLLPYATMECLLRMAQAKTVDSKVVRALLHVLSLFPVGSYVELSDGSTARVLRSNRDEYTKPIVQLLQDPEGQPITPVDNKGIVDLSHDKLSIVKAVSAPGRNEIGLSPEILSHTRR